MSQRTKVIVGIGVVLVAIAILLLVFLLVRNNEPAVKRDGLFGFIDSVNPFTPGGGLISPGDEPGEEPSDNPEAFATTTLPRLRKISAGPVAGFIGTTTANGFSFRYVERKTGHVYDGLLESEETVRVSNTTIPRIQEAVFVRGGEQLLFQYLSTSYTEVNSLYATISEAGKSLSFSQVSNEAAEVVSSPNKSSLVSFSSDSTGGRIGTINTKETVLYRSTIHKWRGSYAGANTLLIYPAATAFAPNATYLLNDRSGKPVRLVGARMGLEGIGWNDYFLFSQSEARGIKTVMYNKTTEQFTDIFALTTLADKCLLAPPLETTLFCGNPKSIPSENYPDAWLEGRVAFEDRLIAFDIKTGEEIDNFPVTLPEAVDIVNLQLTPDGKYLGFLNKRDGSLWALRLSEE